MRALILLATLSACGGLTSSTKTRIGVTIGTVVVASVTAYAGAHLIDVDGTGTCDGPAQCPELWNTRHAGTGLLAGGIVLGIFSPIIAWTLVPERSVP